MRLDFHIRECSEFPANSCTFKGIHHTNRNGTGVDDGKAAKHAYHFVVVQTNDRLPVGAHFAPIFGGVDYPIARVALDANTIFTRWKINV